MKVKKILVWLPGLISCVLAQTESSLSQESILSKLQLPESWHVEESSMPEIPVFIKKEGAITETIAFTEVGVKTRKWNAPKSLEAYKIKLEKSVNTETHYFGAKDWKITSIESFPIAQGTLFKLRGNYLGSAHQPVFFEEWKFFLRKGFAQVTFSREGEANLGDPRYIEGLMNRFKPFGESL